MVDAPEKIWIEQDGCPYFYEESELTEVGSPVTEYIRADIHARALLSAKRERQDEIARLNTVIERMQRTMSSQAEQWSRSMDTAKREGMEGAAETVQAYLYEHKFVRDQFAQLIRAKINEAPE